MWKILFFFIFIQAISGKNTELENDVESYVNQPSISGVISSLNTITVKFAKIAREIVHKSDYATLATIASQEPIKGYPVINTIAIADSEQNATSTGNINFYLQKNDPIYYNVRRKNELSVLFTNQTNVFNNETSSVETVGYRVLITGYLAQLPVNTTEYDAAKAAIISRHPESTNVLKRLNAILCKVEIDHIAVSDDTIGQFFVTEDDYYYADVDE